jgi:hypothetical protein
LKLRNNRDASDGSPDLILEKETSTEQDGAPNALAQIVFSSGNSLINWLLFSVVSIWRGDSR